jgi:lipopolysaccharide/colanic/teichoic acid biosynthesis glycosyltransferase
MRYQSPIGNPLSQYWEEELVLSGVSRYWKDSLAGFKYFLAEHLFANFILIVSVILKAISPKPVVMSAVRFYRTYGFTWTVKRLLDIIGAAFGIILTIPVFIIIPIVIKLDSPGPVFFSQERIGKNRRRNDRRSMNMATTTERRNNDRRQNPGYGMPFVIYKFRTMRQDAEKLTGPVWARKKDPRITRIGAILRATRIDEIPQLFNVLKGEMSLVGPRPERAFFIGKLRESISDYEKRLLVRPGLTGLAQVEHKYDESEADTVIKVKYDINYIRNLNIVNDFKIMLKTIYVVFAAKGM